MQIYVVARKQEVGKESKRYSGQSDITCELSRSAVFQSYLGWYVTGELDTFYLCGLITDAPLGISGKGNIQEHETVTLAILSGLKTVSLVQAWNPGGYHLGPFTVSGKIHVKEKDKGLCLYLLSIGFCHITQTGIQLVNLIPQSAGCWDYRQTCTMTPG